MAPPFAGPVPLYVHQDHLASTRLTTTAAGAVQGRYNYEAFGAPSSATAPVVRHMFAGEAWEADAELQYLRARHYAPGTGRFVSMDPYEGTREHAETRHGYFFAKSDPVNLVDPTGLDPLGVSFAIGIAPTLVGAAGGNASMTVVESFNGRAQAIYLDFGANGNPSAQDVLNESRAPQEVARLYAPWFRSSDITDSIPGTSFKRVHFDAAFGAAAAMDRMLELPDDLNFRRGVLGGYTPVPGGLFSLVFTRDVQEFVENGDECFRMSLGGACYSKYGGPLTMPANLATAVHVGEVAAHELGHAFGLGYGSDNTNYPSDIMGGGTLPEIGRLYWNSSDLMMMESILGARP